jgi:hypothetical protein
MVAHAMTELLRERGTGRTRHQSRRAGPRDSSDARPVTLRIRSRLIRRWLRNREGSDNSGVASQVNCHLDGGVQMSGRILVGGPVLATAC